MQNFATSATSASNTETQRHGVSRQEFATSELPSYKPKHNDFFSLFVASGAKTLVADLCVSVPLCWKRLQRTFCILHSAFCILLLSSCRTASSDSTKPLISYQVNAHQIEKLPCPFEPLQEQERSSDWGKELVIGRALGKELDLYRATTALKRALILLGDESEQRKKEILYDLLLAYYLGGKTEEVCATYEKSPFAVNQDFKAARELFLILYDSYLRRGQQGRAQAVLPYLAHISPELQKKVIRYTELQCLDLHNPLFDPLSKEYMKLKKSPFTAGFLQAVLPGSGYLYVGQRQTALTSLCINAVFLVATWELAHAGYTAAALITGSLECGWYFGGINGASIAAKEYNRTLYSTMAGEFAAKEKLFPFQLFQYGF